MKRLVLLVALYAGMATGCELPTWLRGPEIPMAVSASGSFDCGSGFHGCSAWLAVRPAGWQAPDRWAPGTADRKLELRPSERDWSIWLVTGPGVGGPDALPPGDYRFMAVITEIDDTKPWVLGTDDRPGTGVLNLFLACERVVTVRAGATAVAVAVSFGPSCAIEAAAVEG